MEKDDLLGGYRDSIVDYLANLGVYFTSTFEAVLTLLTLITFIAWLYYKLRLKKRIENYDVNPASGSVKIIDNLRSFFWVFLVVLVLRSFVVHYSKVSDAAMEPQIAEGTYVLYHRSAYQIRIPGFKNSLINISKPKRGDNVIYFAPSYSDAYNIGRVVALPGDQVELDIKNKSLVINGKKQPYHFKTHDLNASEKIQYRWKLAKDSVLVLPNVLYPVNLSGRIDSQIIAKARSMGVDLPPDYSKQVSQISKEMVRDRRIVKIKNILGKVVYQF